MHASLSLVRATHSTRYALAAALVGLIGLSLFAAPASADLGRLNFTDATAPTCSTLPWCSPTGGSDCFGMAGSDCLMLPGHGVSICTTLPSPDLEAFCCDTRTDCPVSSAGSTRECTTVTGLPDGAPGVCVDTSKNWCVADPGSSIDPLTLRQCLTPTTAVVGATLSWDTGDCDQDGVANAEDPCPCRPAPADSAIRGCPDLIADAGVLDGGPPVDAGSADSGPLDAGLPSDDAGLPSEDAGPAVDDSGVAPTPDTGITSDGDASTTPSEDAGGSTGSFTGAGGCALSQGRSGTEAFALGFALLGLVWRRRRR